MGGECVVADAVGREPVFFPALQGDFAEMQGTTPFYFLISICLQWLTRFLPSLFCREKYEGLQGRAG